MQPHCHSLNLTAIYTVAAPVRCPGCDDWMIAPVSSEFVENIGIRHIWECDSCGAAFSTFVPFTRN
jgi:hypothetical protein